MIEEDFYATIKLKNGEEIFSKVSPTVEDDMVYLLLSNPVVVNEFKTRGVEGYKIEPWLKTNKEDLIIIKMEDVLTISESSDVEIISMHQTYTRKTSHVKKGKSGEVSISETDGYISNVNDTKELLEKIFKKDFKDNN